MKVKEIAIDSSCMGEYQAEVTFITNNPSDTRYISDNRIKDFVAIAKRNNDGLSAKYYAFDELSRSKTRKNKDKVIFNPPATILIRNGKKFVSKAHNEEFDEEKGLLMCLAKANGITHLELKRMIKNAKRFKDENNKEK